MSTVGIIAEFNPFHNGHKYLISKAKEITGADNVICIISGDFTQAGNIAVEDKFKRAKRAIEYGADLVIELPVLYAISSAEYFSSGAIDILEKLHSVDYLCFGSETGDTEELIFIANTLISNDEDIWKKISSNMKNGISFAEAREKAISNFLTDEQTITATSSNNILAIEYIKRLIKLESDIKPIAIKRQENDNTVSATQIRKLLFDKENYSKFVPNYTIDRPDIILDDYFNNIVKYLVRRNGGIYLSNINEVTEGLENRIIESYMNPNNLNYIDSIKDIKSKRYQMSKIKRIFLNILINIKKDDFNSLYLNFGYAHVIAINEKMKNELLSMLNKNSSIPVLTSINDTIISNLDDNNKKALKLDIAAHNIYSMANNTSTISDYNNKL